MPFLVYKHLIFLYKEPPFVWKETKYLQKKPFLLFKHYKQGKTRPLKEPLEGLFQSEKTSQIEPQNKKNTQNNCLKIIRPLIESAKVKECLKCLE